MVDTSIKVDERVRARLAKLARERGSTIRDVVAGLAAAELTQDELDDRYARAHSYITASLCPELTEADIAAGQWVWDELSAGRTPASLRPPTDEATTPGVSRPVG